MVRKTGKELLKMVFDYLIMNGQKDSALKVAKVLIRDISVKLVLGIGDDDWNIQTAIERFGGEVKSSPSNPNIAYFSLEYYHTLDEEKYNETYDLVYNED